MTVVGRLLTLPIRPHLPDFYVLGFPVCDQLLLDRYSQQQRVRETAMWNCQTSGHLIWLKSTQMLTSLLVSILIAPATQ